MAVHFIRPVLPDTLKIILPVVIALAAGLHLGWFDKNEANFRAFPWLKTLVGTACLVLATFELDLPVAPSVMVGDEIDVQEKIVRVTSCLCFLPY